MSKTIRSLVLGLFIAGILYPMRGYSQNLDISYENQTLEQVMADLKQKTECNFVYQKHVLEGKRTVTMTFTNVPLTYVLDRLLLNENLDYEIVKNTVVIKEADKNNFKKVVTGRVTDEEYQPLPGVNIRIKDTQVGVATDVDGQFSIVVDNKYPILVFSFVGMFNREIRINQDTKTPLNIEMISDVSIMEEVIVTGYQNIKRENATGAYQMISSKEMDSRYTTDIVANLEGKVPGLVSYNNGRNGDGESTLTIRGVGSFQAKTNPLVVVDGLPIEGSIETVNRHEIENITILKDASAASIYGARASNGVIVITTKKAQSEKLSIEVSGDLTIHEKQNYDNYKWATPSQLIDLEGYNFDYVVNDPTAYKSLKNQYDSKRNLMSPISLLMMEHHLGLVGNEAYQTQINKWKKNNYRKEWQDVVQQHRLLQEYNVALRTRGKYLSSSIVLNYKGDNNGMKKEKQQALTLNYNGDLTVNKYLNFSFGLNLIRENSKTHADLFGYKNIHAFDPYLSMYNEDGSEAQMRASVDLSEPSLADQSLGLKSEAYNLLDEVNQNFTKANRTNLRSFIHANLNILPVLKLSGQFQYENIYYKSEKHLEGNSYDMRHLYNLFTSEGVHYIPDGGMLGVNTDNGNYYTFRTQASYSQALREKHVLEAVAGFEYRETKGRSTNSMLFGYDDQTQTNVTAMMNFDVIRNLKSTDLGANYTSGFNPAKDGYPTTETLHRFYSLYFNGNYTYDKRYSASFSYRVDKTDLFGADPKFRGRPLWSAGLSWNINNEDFMKTYDWLDVLKLRASYGLTGNIDSSVSSYLTARITTNDISGDKMAKLNTPPNDQLRWEKTASWNLGLDFSLFRNRLSGSLDWYRKLSSDLLTLTDLDPTTGWRSLTINNGEALNTGIELMLDGTILQATSREEIGIRIPLSFAYNKNAVKKTEHKEASGFGSLKTFHKDRPVNSLYSWRFAGYATDDNGNQQITWEKADGSIENVSVIQSTFTPEDVVFSGGLDPKYVASLAPEISWQGITLSAMCSYYGGHYMRARVEDYTVEGTVSGYSNLAFLEAVPQSYLNYWTSGNKNVNMANGYPSININNCFGEHYIDQAVYPADYFKLRNITLGYNFPKTLCQKVGITSMRLRAQINNVATWVKNKVGIDPEANNPYTGMTLDKTPRSYTMSLNINL